MPRCIYCGISIPDDIGLRCQKCNDPTPTHKSYDKEFNYDPDVYGKNQELVPQLMDEAASYSYAKTGRQTQEEAHRLFESNAESRKAYKWAQQNEFKIQRQGRIFHMNEFLRLVRKVNDRLNIWYTDRGGMRGTLGLFVAHEGLLKKCQHIPGAMHYIGFVQVPFMQEYEELNFDRYDVPLGSKRRGWRTVLLNMQLQKLISEDQTRAVFGDPATGVVSRRYRETLWHLRNNPT